MVMDVDGVLVTVWILFHAELSLIVVVLCNWRLDDLALCLFVCLVW